MEDFELHSLARQFLNTNVSSSTTAASSTTTTPSCDVVLNMDAGHRALSRDEQNETEYLVGLILERLQSELGDMEPAQQRQLGHAVETLVRDMSHTDALAYLQEGEDDMSRWRDGDYRPCFYTAALESGGAAIPARYVAPNTFLVDARAHFTYAYVIDQLMLQDQLMMGGTELLVEAARQRFEWRAQYMKLTPGCLHDDDESRACALCSVLYTRVDSDFYQRCRARITASLQVNFLATSSTYMDLERLSFQLVLFLCGSQLIGDATATRVDELRYAATNQWLRVPVWFLLLYTSERA